MRFLRRTITPSVVSLLFLLATAAPSDAGLFGNPGARKLRRVLRSPAVAAAHVGIEAVDLASGKTVFAENAEKLFIPASSAKLLTAYAAFKVLTPGYVFRTEFATDVFVDSRTVHNLYIKGYGDPSVTLADINLQAVSLCDAVSEVRGDIVVDSTYFDGLQFGRGWMWDEGIVAWNAPIAPYAVHGNCIDVVVRPGAKPGDPVTVYTRPATAYAVVVSSAVTGTADDLRISREETPAGDRFIVAGTLAAGRPGKTWQCAVSRPGLYAGTLFKELLTRYGVRVRGNVCEAPRAGTIPVCSYDSRSLADIVRYFLKESDNLTGECILKTIGAVHAGPPGTADKGVAAVRAVLRERSIPEKAYTLVDGSGLSTYNQLTPDILVRVLRAAGEDFAFSPEFMDALAVAGQDGTLKHRLGNTALTGYLRAKTGTMSGVSCLAGYLQTRSGRVLAVAVMMNGFTGSAQALRAVQDDIVKTLWENY
jgi:D-alanyl-D-alanine carboxypeptidase/D-alanyl-D-alanine-endopeptidase (penicillin-binding protein 4)